MGQYGSGVQAGGVPLAESISVTNALQSTTCCIVGAGPAGVILAWLLAREGISVTLLERHADFERDFRGDTLHPGVLEILDQMGLAERVLALTHTRMQTLSFHTAQGSVLVADLRRLRTRFPYVAMLPQSQFLNLVAEDARRFETFRLVMGADARELIEEGNIVRGVRYVDSTQQSREVRADLRSLPTDARPGCGRHVKGAHGDPFGPRD